MYRNEQITVDHTNTCVFGFYGRVTHRESPWGDLFPAKNICCNLSIFFHFDLKFVYTIFGKVFGWSENGLRCIKKKLNQDPAEMQRPYIYGGVKNVCVYQNVERCFAKRGKSNMFMERYCSGNSWLFAWFSQG